VASAAAAAAPSEAADDWRPFLTLLC
jgi:hypothetical protein